MLSKVDNLFANGRRPQYSDEWKTSLIFGIKMVFELIFGRLISIFTILFLKKSLLRTVRLA